MAISKLNEDCINLIIEELYNRRSLFPCLLVNRFWYKMVVPILWRDPWEIFKDENEVKLANRAKKFFNIVLLYLSEESRNHLKNQEIDISQQKSPLFNYINFIKHIKHIVANNYSTYHNIYKCDIYKKQYNDTQRNILEQEIYKLFISKCSSIKFLYITGVKQQLYAFPGAETSLSKLYELHCNSSDDSSLFYGLAKICRSIGKFRIYYEGPSPGLAKLIEVQQKIKYLRIIQNLSGSESSVEVEREIMKKAYQFHYLDIETRCKENLSFSNNLLSKSINLQELKLFTRNGHCILIMYISLSRMSRYQGYSESFQMTWKVLTRLKFDIPGQLNETISKHYPKVKYIEIVVFEQDLEAFEQILINFQNLEGLIIDLICCLEEVLDILSESASDNVYKIQIICNLSGFNEEYLENFFNNWRGRKPMWLHLWINTCDHENNDKLPKSLIEKYVKEGVIKKYVYTYESIIDNYDEFPEGFLYGRLRRNF